MRHTLLFALLLLPAAAVAQPAQQKPAPQPTSAYRAVMKAQYEAKEAPKPMRPEEAKRIYENYLRSVARSRSPAGETGSEAGTSPR